MSYRNLEIWQRARDISIKVHELSLSLPGFELYETGSQIRRSSKSVRANIVEGYGRRAYKNDYIRFLIFSLASNDETRDHLDVLFETKSLKNKELYLELCNYIETLGKMLNRFISAIHKAGPTPPPQPLSKPVTKKPETRNQ